MTEDKPFEHLGIFPTLEEAILATEMDDALHGGREPLDFYRRQYHSEPEPGYLYTIREHVLPPLWRVTYAGPDGGWIRGFDTIESAQAACQADWSTREEQTA